MTPIYLDTNATTPVDPAVLEAMLPFLRDEFGNPSSGHDLGRTARDAVAMARAQVAEMIGAQPDEIVFTGGGSEAGNLAIQGVAFAGERLGHFVTTAIEHPATLAPLEFLRKRGARVTIVGVDRNGIVDPTAMAHAVESDTRLVSVMHANNEVGTIQPVRDIAGKVRPRGVLLHTDAAQSLGKIPVNVNDLGVDLLSIAGHKLYAPKGVGALFVRRGVPLEPLIHGAGQERGLRAGTENVPYIVALGRACELARHGLAEAGRKLAALRDRLWERLLDGLGDAVVQNGDPNRRLPNTLNVSFRGWTGAALLAQVPEVAASTGSACHDRHGGSSPVLSAMGMPGDVGRGAVRLSVGRFTSDVEIDRAAALLIAGANSLPRHATENP